MDCRDKGRGPLNLITPEGSTRNTTYLKKVRSEGYDKRNQNKYPNLLRMSIYPQPPKVFMAIKESPATRVPNKVENKCFKPPMNRYLQSFFPLVVLLFLQKDSPLCEAKRKIKGYSYNKYQSKQTVYLSYVLVQTIHPSRQS